MPYDNPYQEQHPILSPLLRAYQLYNAVQENKRQQQAMDMQRQQFEAAQQQRALDNQYRQDLFNYNKGQDEYTRQKTEETNTYNRRVNAIEQQQNMAQMGAQPVQTVGDWWFGKNKGAFVPSITGEKRGYKLKSEEQQTAKKIQDLITTGKIEGANDLYKMQLLLPFQSAMKQSAVQPHVFQATDAAGNLNYMGINPITGQQVYSGSQSGFGAPKEGAKAKQPTTADFSRFEELKRKALESYREAEIQQAAGDEKSVKKAAILRAQGKSLFEQAHAAGTALMSQFPDIVEYGQDAQGYPYIKRRQ